MIALMSLASLCCGTVLAAKAPSRPEHTATMESLGGAALVFGLAMIGVGLGS